MPSIFLKAGLTDFQLVSLCLTMLQVTKNMHQMHYRHAKFSKTLFRLGNIKKVVRECEPLPTKLIKQDKIFITTMITLQCLVGSRERRKLFEKGDYGQKKDLMPSVTALNARRTRLLAAVFHATWFYFSVITPQGTYYIVWSHLWLLS